MPSVFGDDFFGLGNIVKLFNRGDIHSAYEKMNETAQRLAAQETLEFMQHQGEKGLEDQLNHAKIEVKFDILTKTYDYHQERVAYHMKEMKDMLYAKIKADEKKEGK